MDFVGNLRRYLRQVAPSEAELLPWEIGADECRQAIVQALRRMKEWSTPDDIKVLHADWMTDDTGVLLLREMARGLHASLRLSRDEVKQVLPDAALHLLAPHQPMPRGRSLVTSLEVDRLFQDLDEAFFGAYVGTGEGAPDPSWWQQPVLYAHEIRATRHMTRGIVLTPLGQVTLGLPDRDVVRWLLHVEVAEATSNAGRLLTRRQANDLLVNVPERIQIHEVDFNVDRPDVGDWPYPAEVLRRLVGMGLVERGYFDTSRPFYHLADSGRPLLEEIVQKKETPFAVLVHALLDDETTRTLSAVPGVALPGYGLAAEGVARQARQYAHELGNLLGSLRLAVDDLTQGDPRPSAEVQRARERTYKLVDRLSRMKDEMHEVAVRIPLTREVFDVGACLRDAVAALNGEGQCITVKLPQVLPPVLGYRQRFVLALGELLRNALRAAGGSAADVRVAASLVGNQMIITVDDNGPGVPLEQREAIFVPGFTSRAAGSGQGLALVREVIQQELRGEITCEAGPLGGARFVIKLPLQPEATK